METIQQLIKSYDLKKDNQVYKQIIERLKSEESIWISFMPYTNNYYLDYESGKPAGYLFSEKQYYEEYQDYMLQQQIFVSPLESKKEQRMFMFGDLYRSGFEMLVIDNGQTHLVMSLFDVIDEPDFSNVPEINKPIMNPTLVCAANHFFQELRSKKATKVLEENMFKEIYHAKYLMPMDASKLNMENKNTEDGTRVIKEDSIIQFPLVTNKEEKNFYPFFTDWNEFKRFDKDLKYSGNIVGFEEFKAFIEQADGITINPYGVNIILTKDMIENIDEVANGLPQKIVVKEQVAKKDTKVLLGEPAEYPNAMIDAICKYLKTNKKINAAYLRLMIKDDEQSYLIVVDFTGDMNEVFSKIANVGTPFSNGKYLDFVPLSSDFGRDAVKDVVPFYKKKKFGIF